ncbi:MAG: flagellar hook-basal body complex protein FliE [Acidimicrobiia bacterium]
MPIQPIRMPAAVDAGVTGPRAASDVDFSKKIGDAVQSVSNAEGRADAIATDLATGGSTNVHELMLATTKASLQMDLMVQVRNRAVEAYQEIMRMPL